MNIEQADYDNLVRDAMSWRHQQCAAQPKPESWQEIADEHANAYIMRLRNWQGFDLNEYQQAQLRKVFLLAIERSHAAQPQRSDSPWVGKSERRFIEQQQRSDPPPSAAKATDDKQEWTTAKRKEGVLLCDIRRIDGTLICELISEFKGKPIVAAHNAELATDRKFYRENNEIICERLVAERHEVKLRDQTIALGKQVACELERQLDAECEEVRIMTNQCVQLRQELAAERQRCEQQGKAAERLKAEHKKQFDKALKACEFVTKQYLSALAAIEKHNKQYENCSIKALSRIKRDTGYETIDTYDLSVLHKHDAEVRKPLVDALELIGEVKLRQGDAIWMRDTAIDALAKAKEGECQNQN